MDQPGGKTSCANYREEMMLLGLLRRLQDDRISEEEKTLIRKEARALESEMGLEGFTDNSQALQR